VQSGFMAKKPVAMILPENLISTTITNLRRPEFAQTLPIRRAKFDNRPTIPKIFLRLIP
jgi:hypothetical protein